MAAVTVWFAVLFLVLIPKQSNEVSDQFSDSEFENLDVETYKQRISDPKTKDETVYTECKEQVENEKRVLAAAFSLLKLTDDETKRNLLHSENLLSILIKHLEAKDAILQSNNETLLQMQDTICGLTKTEGANILTLQELREKQKQLQATIDCKTYIDEANNRTLQELREMKEQLQATLFAHSKILEEVFLPFDTVCRRLLDAAKSGDVNSAKFWVKYGNDSCVARDNYNYTALIVAARYGHVEVVRVLLEGGANIEGTGGYGWTAVMVAAEYGKLDVCRLLLDRGAKVNAVSNYGQTALHWAAYYGQLSVVKLLVERGADVTVKNKDGRTAIERARSSGHKDVVQWLGSVSQG